VSDIEPTNPDRVRRSFARLVAFVVALVVVVVVFGFLLFHFTSGGGSTRSPGSNVSSPGAAQPGPTQSPTPGIQR
jgi:ABC-type transporter Mla subunit MlaD